MKILRRSRLHQIVAAQGDVALAQPCHRLLHSLVALLLLLGSLFGRPLKIFEVIF